MGRYTKTYIKEHCPPQPVPPPLVPQSKAEEAKQTTGGDPPCSRQKHEIKDIHDAKTKITEVLNDVLERLESQISHLTQQSSGKQWEQVGHTFDMVVKLYQKMLNYEQKLQDLRVTLPKSTELPQPHRPMENLPSREELTKTILDRLEKYRKTSMALSFQDGF